MLIFWILKLLHDSLGYKAAFNEGPNVGFKLRPSSTSLLVAIKPSLADGVIKGLAHQKDPRLRRPWRRWFGGAQNASLQSGAYHIVD